jgi:cAMP-binding proteins - catabolite gene activator and regulatory subunit of cAMP-dependent protein kinases
MSVLPFITSDSKLFNQVKELLSEIKPGNMELAPLSEMHDALDFLNIEMPDLVFINYSDPVIDAFDLTNHILADSWLHHGGIIALYKDYETIKAIEKIVGANIIISLSFDQIKNNLSKILTIINNNRRFLFQRAIGTDLISTISGSYYLNNDPIESSCYANLICNFLFNTDKIDIDSKSTINMALNELLINAIEHGNCGITYEEKSAWLENNSFMEELIKMKCQDPIVRQRRVLFEYTITPEKSSFLISDEGSGFDWRNIKDATAEENIFEEHGRGILLSKKFTKNFAYNEKGNEVTFEIEHKKDGTNAVPALFENIEPVTFKKGDYVFQEGETSDFLYYIVKGKYSVILNGTVVSSLSPEDIFMGEMSFLLNNRRSATVCAQTSGKLIKISKKDFVKAIKNQPHYALFLSRLLAQRLQRGNVTQSIENRPG